MLTTNSMFRSDAPKDFFDQNNTTQMKVYFSWKPSLSNSVWVTGQLHRSGCCVLRWKIKPVLVLQQRASSLYFSGTNLTSAPFWSGLSASTLLRCLLLEAYSGRCFLYTTLMLICDLWSTWTRVIVLYTRSLQDSVTAACNSFRVGLLVPFVISFPLLGFEDSLLQVNLQLCRTISFS